MAKFESRFGIGDHVWTLDESYCTADGYQWETTEWIVASVRFTSDSIFYKFKAREVSPRREQHVYATAEEAARHLPRDVDHYIRCGLDDPAATSHCIFAGITRGCVRVEVPAE